MVDAHTSLYELIAAPTGHSLSPLIHNTSFQTLGINSVYLAFDVDQKDFGDVIKSMRVMPIQGINVSMPYKERIIEYVDELTPIAKQLGAVNTVINQNGHLVGDSTDGEGFINALLDEHVAVNGKRVAVLGAGGAGRAVIAAAAGEGATITAFKRHNETFGTIRDRLTGWSDRIAVVPYEDEDLMKQVISQADVIVNTTNVGMGDDHSSPVPRSVADVLHPGQMVVDVIYAPLETTFLAQARQQGCRTMNGIGMLVQQAAGSFYRWTKQVMPIETVKAAIHNQITEPK